MKLIKGESQKQERFNLFQGDCLEVIRKLSNKSVDLILIDPPYNIDKAEWDTWRTVEEYADFMENVFMECERVLKDTGSFYFFHNDFLQIIELQKRVQKTNLIFKSLITLKKKEGSFVIVVDYSDVFLKKT